MLLNWLFNHLVEKKGCSVDNKIFSKYTLIKKKLKQEGRARQEDDFSEFDYIDSTKGLTTLINNVILEWTRLKHKFVY
jgi:hypothetical protein